MIAILKKLTEEGERGCAGEKMLTRAYFSGASTDIKGNEHIPALIPDASSLQMFYS